MRYSDECASKDQLETFSYQTVKVNGETSALVLPSHSSLCSFLPT